MQLTKGAIGNLINRYKAVLKKCHLMNTFGSLAVAGMLVMGGAGMAVGAPTAGISVNTNTQHDEDVNIAGGYDIGVYASGAKADFSGKQLHIATTPGTGWGSGNVGLWANSTAPSDDRSVINFGQAGTTESINITVTDDSEKKDISIGVWSRGDQNKAGGEINLNAETVTIKGHSDSGWIYGIYAQNATTTTEDDRATININAGKTYIDVTSGEPGRANAIVAMSQGVINIESDLYVNTQGGQGNAIVTRGDSIIAINSSGTHTVQMNGNVNFNYDDSTSGTKVDADVDITLSGADSYWNGNTLISWNGSPDSSKLKVSEMTLTVKDGATWTPTAISDSDSQKYTALNKLTLDGGIVDVNKGVAITIENIDGKGAITNAGSVTIEKGSIEGPITFEKGDATADNMVTVGKDGITTLTGGVAGSGTIDKLAIAEDGKTTITNAKLSGHDGRALWNNGTLTVNGGSFEGNTAKSAAGAIYNADGAKLTVDGVSFKENTAKFGGAINNAKTASDKEAAILTVKNSQFIGNTSLNSQGGAIRNQGTITEISGSTFKGNKASNGGAINNGEWGQIKLITNSVFDGNEATLENAAAMDGGAILNRGTIESIADSTFTNNKTSGAGGAILNKDGASLTFNGTNTFTNNTAASKANDIHNSGTITVASGTTTLGSGYSQDAGSLTVQGGAALESLGTMEISGGSVAFEDNSLFAVNGNALTGDNAAITVMNGGTLTVEKNARLRIDNARSGQNFNIVNGTDTTTNKWTQIEAGTDLLTPTMDENGNVTFKRDKDASDVFTGMDSNTAAMLNTLIDKGLNNVDSDQMGVRFLSRTVEKTYLGADKDAAAATIESAARIAFAGAVPQMTKMASDAGSNAVVNRLGFANPADGAQAMDAEGKIVDRNTTGFALWIAPLWQSQHGWGMEAGNLDYGFNGNLGGVSLGADYTFENAIRAGITFNIGGGYAESSGGDLNSTENRMSFWGLGAYAGWNYENFGLMADVSYTSTWNDLKQDMDSRMGMGDLEADVQASAISAGLRAEYKLETSVLDVIPHIGVRYMSLNTWGFDAESNGGTVLEGDGFHQDIWTFPVGVTFTKDFTLDSGWSVKPSIDFSVIPAAGDIKAKQDVAFTGLPGSYEVETQMMDYLTWQGGVGLEMGNDTMSFGVNYTLQAGQHTTGHGVFGSFRYEF